MAKQKKIKAISEIIRKEIIEYCTGLLTLLPETFLEENSILENEFLEYLYNTCEASFLCRGDFRLTHIELGNLVQSKKEADFTIFEIEQGRAIITGIDKDDTLEYNYKEEQKQIDNNEKK